MYGIADDCLIEVANLDFNATLCVGDRAEVSDMAITTNPDWRPLGHGANFQGVKPLIEVDRVAAHVGVRGPRHLQVALVSEDFLTLGEAWKGPRFYLHWISEDLPSMKDLRLFSRSSPTHR